MLAGLGGAEHLAGAGLVAAHPAAAGFLVAAQGLQESERAQAHHIRRELRLFEADLYMALGAQVVDLLGLDLIQDAPQVLESAVAVVQEEPRIEMGIHVEVVDAVGVEEEARRMMPWTVWPPARRNSAR